MSIFGNLNPIGSYEPKDNLYTHNPDYSVDASLEEPPQAKKFEGFFALLVVLLSLLVIRLLALQVSQGTYNLRLAEGNRIRTKIIPAPRGMIFDQTGQPLLKNVVRYSLALVPADLPDKKANREEVYKQIAESLGRENDFASLVEKKGLFSIEPIILENNITQESALRYQVIFNDLPGIEVIKQPIRSYLDNLGLGHVVGYIGKISQAELSEMSGYNINDWVGKAGLEKTYEKDVKGESGQDQIEIDSRGRLQRIVAHKDPKQGNNLKLNLDLELQRKTYSVLKEIAERNGSAKGVALAMDPRSGGVYALVSLPDYNSNVFINNDETGINNLFQDKNKPLLDRAIGGNYPSGSVIKPLYAAAALQENLVSPSFSVDTPSEIKIGSYNFPDWKDHGVTDIRRAIAESNNIFFYGIGGGWDKIKGLGIKKMEDYLKRFGMGSQTKIDLPNEAKGFVPTPEWKRSTKKEPWYIGDTYHLAIGQGDILVTPIQMATAISGIANNGRLISPRLVKTIENVDGQEIRKNDPEVLREHLVDGEDLQVVREGMRQAVESGSARLLQDLSWPNGDKIATAGKTGTAQTGKDDKTHAWFVGFAPMDDPKIVVTVLVEEGGDGNAVALPVAKEMLRAFFRDDNPAAK